MATQKESNIVMSANIQRLLEEHNKTRKDVCTALGINYATFSDWLQGRSYPRPDKVEKLAAYFNVSRSDLVDPPHTSTVSVGRDNNAPIINGATIDGNVTINQQHSAPNEFCQMCQALPDDAMKRIYRMVKGEYEDAMARMGKEGK